MNSTTRSQNITKTIAVSLPPYLIKALAKMALNERRSVSNMLRVILEDRLEAPQGDAGE